jgi:sulfate adenylyltransferase
MDALSTRYNVNGHHDSALTNAGELEDLRKLVPTLPSITLDQRQICDLELLLNGGFSPLIGFLNRFDYLSVVEEMRLTDGQLWPMPVTLAVDDACADVLSRMSRAVLRDVTGVPIAVMEIEHVWMPDLEHEAMNVFGTTSTEHPGVAALYASGGHYVGGRVRGIQLPRHDDFQTLRHTPEQLREAFTRQHWTRIVAFQTRNPMHRAHKELTDRAAASIDGHLLIHPAVGMTKPGDIGYFTRVRCYRHLLKKYPDGRAMLSLLPLAMRMAGPREAVWHAMIRKNFGCTHFIVGRDHAGPGHDSSGKPFYDRYAAQRLLTEYEDEIGIRMIPFEEMVYVSRLDRYLPVDEVKERQLSFTSISGTELRRRLETGEPIPDWFSYPDVVSELRRARPPRWKKGLTIFFTGLSGSGKSTIANGLVNRIMERTGRAVTLLDGDVVRTHLSQGLDFSREGRSMNVRRIGYVAAEITRHGGVVVCAPIAPYEEDRRYNRSLISSLGGYVEVFVDAPLDVCESRDVKGLYARARAGLLKEFTGIDDPYEIPFHPEVVCNTADESIEESINRIVSRLEELGYLSDGTGLDAAVPAAELVPQMADGNVSVA